MAKISKKTSKDGSLSLYLGKRDYVDNVDSVEVVDGVLKIDPANLNGRKVWCKLSCAFRYGTEDLDVIGLSFRKDIWTQRFQMYPPTGDAKPANTAIQTALMKKCGDQGHPFTFEIPTNLPCSVSLQPGPNDKGKCCGVDFEVKAYMAKEPNNPDEKIEKKDTCRLVVRKIQFAPKRDGPGAKNEINDKQVRLEGALEKEVYLHGESITVKVKANNESSKAVKKIKVSVEQVTDVCLYSSDKYVKTVCCEEFGDTVNPNSTFEKDFKLTPLLSNNQDKHGLAVDGRLKDQDTNLASSTLLANGQSKEVQGILVSYKVKITLNMGGGGLLGGLMSSDVTLELPLTLMAPKPAEVDASKLGE